MQFLLALIVLLIFAAIWYLPIVKRQQAISGVVTKKTLWKTFFLCLLPGGIVILILESILGWGLKFAHITEDMMLYQVLYAFIIYSMVEEFVKYFGARFMLRKNTEVKRIDIMVVFAAAGLGYEVIETAVMGNLIASISRGIFVAHMMYQLVMGHFYCESLKAKAEGDEGKAKKMAVFALLIPMIIHGVNDMVCQLIGYEGLGIDPTIMTIVCVVFLFVLQVVTAIVGVKLSKKDQDLSLTLPAKKAENADNA